MNRKKAKRFLALLSFFYGKNSENDKREKEWKMSKKSKKIIKKMSKNERYRLF